MATFRQGFAWLSLQTDSRGNRLEDYLVCPREGTGEHDVLLRCCNEIAQQVGKALESKNPKPIEPQLVDPQSDRWTYGFSYDGPYTTRLRDLLELLECVLTFPPIPELTLGLALDFYTNPPDPDNGISGWTYTEAGDLVHRGKYRGQDDAGRQLADRLAEVITKHPAFRDADHIIAAPGTEHRFGERLARGVAKRVDMPACAAVCDAEDHRPAKAGHASAALEPYHLPISVDDEVVIIVDDVFRTGRTMRGIAAAAWAAGAREVLGLVAARTRRK